MRNLISAFISIAFVAVAAPAFAGCVTLPSDGDHANHQSSLSSTTEGGNHLVTICKK